MKQELEKEKNLMKNCRDKKIREGYSSIIECFDGSYRFYYNKGVRINFKGNFIYIYIYIYI